MRKQKSKLIFYFPFFPPAFKAGGPIQSLNNLALLIENDCDVKVICSNEDLGREKILVQSNQWSNYSTKIKVWYSGKVGFMSWLKFLKQQQNEIFYINGVYSVKFNLLPLLISNQKIWAPRGMLDEGSLSQKKLKKKVFINCLKLLRVHKNCVFHATSIEEEKSIKKVFGNESTIKVISNIPKILELQNISPKEMNSLKLVTIALISPMKNILQVVRSLKQIPENIEYNIYGPIKDEYYWAICLQEMQNLASNIKIYYHGDIRPNEVPEKLKEAHAYIQPSKSENFGHSLFEALSLGRPIITSHTTPWKNLQENHAGLNIDPENTQELSDSISFFAKMTHEKLSYWSNMAHQYATKKNDVSKLKQQYLELFEMN